MRVRARKLHLVVALLAALIALAIAACTLNPQPLPPGIVSEDPKGDGNLGGDGSSGETRQDAGAPGSGDSGGNNDSEGGLDAGTDAGTDGGDAGLDAGDSSTDGSAD